jgi:hypothetical protein
MLRRRRCRCRRRNTQCFADGKQCRFIRVDVMRNCDVGGPDRGFRRVVAECYGAGFVARGSTDGAVGPDCECAVGRVGRDGLGESCGAAFGVDAD